MSKDLQAVDVVVLGTGITESIIASALSKAGWKVAHIDVNAFYGGIEASLDIHELSQWMQERGRSNSPSKEIGNSCGDAVYSAGEFAKSKDYSISLTPTIIPATGPFISCLISSGVARYGSFRLLNSVLIYSKVTDSLEPVPTSKEDIFKSQELSLVEKRKLMRFLLFASGEFESSPQLTGKEEMPFAQFLSEAFALDDRLAVQLSCALSFSFSKDDITGISLTRIRQYLRSAGRYGKSPFLIGQYGGLGELAQGFCRICAVAGGTYILARPIHSVEVLSSPQTETTPPFRLCLEDIPDPISAQLLVMSPDYLSLLPPEWLRLDQSLDSSGASTYVMGIVIAKQSEEKHGEPDEGDESNHLDSSVLFFLPGDLPEGKADEAVFVLTNGESTNSCPDGQTVLYLSTLVKDIPGTNVESHTSFSRQLLQPYVDATVRLMSHTRRLEPIFSAFYTRSTITVPQRLSSDLRSRRVIVTQPLDPHLAAASDAAAVEAESIFWEVAKMLKAPDGGAPTTMWPALPDEDDDEW